MKKFILLTIVSGFLLMESASASTLIGAMPSPPAFWVKITINFHRPKTNCLSGFGICADITAGIESQVGSAEQKLCPVKAQLNERNQLVVEITEEALTSYDNGSALGYFKGKSGITILDPYTLTPATCKALGSTTPLTIKPGTYPVTFAEGVYTVVFQL